jgi:hypothetical protein
VRFNNDAFLTRVRQQSGGAPTAIRTPANLPALRNRASELVSPNYFSERGAAACPSSAFFFRPAWL